MIVKNKHEEDLPTGSDKIGNFLLVPDLNKRKTELTLYFADDMGKKYFKNYIIEETNGIPLIHPITRMLES